MLWLPALLSVCYHGTDTRALANAMDAEDSPVRHALDDILAVNGRGKTLPGGRVGWSLAGLEHSLHAISDNQRLRVSILLRNVYNLRHAFDHAPPRGFQDWGEVGSWVAKHYVHATGCAQVEGHVCGA